MFARLARRPVSVLATAIAITGAVTATWAVTHEGSESGGEAEVSSEPPPPPSNSAEAALFMRLGLGADVLCAAGVRAAAVQEICDDANNAMARAGMSLRDHDIAFGSAKVTRDQLKRKVVSGLASAAEVQALARAETAYTAAEQARIAYIDGIRTAGLASVSSAVGDVVERIHDNSTWRLPVEFLAEDREEQEWVDLRDDLATERIAGKYGAPFPTTVQSQLAGYRGRSAVSTARVNLDTYLASVQTAWNSAVTPQ